MPMVNDILDPRIYLGKMVTIQIDRPMGSRHPSEGFIYPVNYGYIEGVPAPDGEDLDAYILGIFEPLEKFTGECIAIVHRLDDLEDKLVVVPAGKWFSDEQISVLIEFQERFFISKIERG